MTWNYRIVKIEKELPESFVARNPQVENPSIYYELHEVFYNDEGIPDGRTAVAIDFMGDEPEDIITALEMALRDVKKSPVLDDKDIKKIEDKSC